MSSLGSTDLEHDLYHYECPDGSVTQWPDIWFSESWFLSNPEQYDTTTHHGSINPPKEVWDSVCPPSTDWSSWWAAKTSDMRAPLAGEFFINHDPSLLDPLANMNTQAGEMDWQAFGVVITAAVTLGVGLILFLLWVILRKKIPAIYSPTSWFRAPGSRPPKSQFRYSLFPMRRLPRLTRPTTEAAVWANMTAGSLIVALIMAIFALAVYLPIYVADVPHLNDTAPHNNRGGRLGSLTDLTFVRLTDALNPAPSSAQGQNRTFSRWQAQTRIIATVVAMMANGLVGLAFSWWVYHELFAYSLRYDAATGGQDMVFISAKKATAWQGLTERVIQRNLLLGAVDEGTVAGVFAVPNTHALRALVRERAHVLDVLETAEHKLIMSFPTEILKSKGKTMYPINGTSPRPTTPRVMSPPPVSRATTPNPTSLHASPRPTSPRSSMSRDQRSEYSVPQGRGGSAFLEDEPVRTGEHLGVSSDGFYPGAGSSMGHAYGQGYPDRAAERGDGYIGNNQGYTVDGNGGGIENGVIAKDHRVMDPPQRRGTDGTRMSMVIDHPYEPLSARPGDVSPELAHLKIDIAWARSRLKRLNGDVEQSQRKVIADIGNCTNIIGWILVGRGVSGLPFAEMIPGRSKDDIIWENLDKKRGRFFYPKRILVTWLVAALCIPFLGLGLASAPGVSWYLGFLAPLARHNDAASGVAEGWCAALGILAILLLAIFTLLWIVRSNHHISWVSHRNEHTESSFRMLRSITTFWLVLISALEYALSSFASGVGELRAIGDGMVYMNWLTFIMMVNCSIIFPALVYLQPLRLARWLIRRNKPHWQTPRQKFRMNYPPDFNPVWAAGPSLAIVCQAATLGAIFPLLNATGLIIMYLIFCGHCWLTKHVYNTTRGGPVDGQSNLFIWGKVSSAIVSQPFVIGIVLLLNQQFEFGGGSMGLFVLLLIILIVSQGGSHKRPVRKCFPEITVAEMTNPAHMDEKARDHHPLKDLHNDRTLSRLEPDNPLPFVTDKIDDLMYTERASHASPDAAAQAEIFEAGADPVYKYGDNSRGMIYPPELLAPAPDVWLPRDGFGVAQREAASLAAEGLTSVIDPVVRKHRKARAVKHVTAIAE